jgi:thiamine pyrophosphate-dependent acetolactate synthase large subunit-like protein
MTACEWLVEGLRQRGVAWMATLCGHGLDPLYHAAKKAGLRLVDTRNEQTAAYLAESCGRLTRQPGVVAVSSGVAHANAMSGVVDAFFDGAPLLLISGAADLRTAGMGHFQDVDQVALAAPVTKFARVIDHPERTLQILQQAWDAACGPPPGPVHLTFPMDVQTTEVPPERMIPPRKDGAGAGLSCFDLDRAAAALAGAEQPLVVAGSGVYYARESEALLGFCEEFSIPVVTPIWDRGSIDRPNEVFLGVIGAASGGPRLLPDADVVVLAGAVADYRLGFLQPGAVGVEAALVRLDRGWGPLADNYRARQGKVHTGWLAEARQRRKTFRAKVEQTAARQAERGLHAIHILNAFREAVTDDALLAIDGGSIGQWAHQLLCDRYPGHWLTCGRSGVVGWGLGGAMAARLVFPDRPVVLLSGDGSFTFGPAEIECAVRQRLPFVAIVADDQAWGITRAGHEAKYGEAISSVLGAVDFVKMAEAFGARGVRATTEDGIREALRTGLASGEVTVIHAPIVGGNP